MKNKLLEYRNEVELELSRILQYWTDNTLDRENGGFYGKINHFNKVIPQAPKGAVLNARILWTFSAAYNFSKNKNYLNVATRAYGYLVKHFYDKENGGLIWEVDYRGNPINKRKQIYAQGFGIYGFSEYFKASGSQQSLDFAKTLFELIESKSYDQEFGGYIEALTQNWKPMEDMRLSEKDKNYPKSMNTHLHILEPYTNLCRLWKDEHLADQMKKLIRSFLDYIIDAETFHFKLFFEKDWEPKSQIISYGHDIEGAWLLTEAAEILGDEVLLQEVRQMALKMTDAILKEGADTDGSLFYEQDLELEHFDTDKHWWPQAEAMIGLLNSFQISGDTKYLEKSMEVWGFIKNNILDLQNGEWFWSVDKNGIPNVSEDKAGFWKCPYHNSRACLEVMHRIRTIQKNITEFSSR